MKLSILGWALVILAAYEIHTDVAGIWIALTSLYGGLALGYRNGKLDAADMLRAELRQGSKLL